MVAWVEKNRVYSNADDPITAAIEIDTYADEHGIRLSVEYVPRSEMRGVRQVYLKRILGKVGDPKGKPAIKPYVGLRK